MAKEITLNLQGGGTVTLDTDTIRVVSAIPKGSSITTVLPNGVPNGELGHTYKVYEVISRIRHMMAQ